MRSSRSAIGPTTSMMTVAVSAGISTHLFSSNLGRGRERGFFVYMIRILPRLLVLHMQA